MCCQLRACKIIGVFLNILFCLCGIASLIIAIIIFNIKDFTWKDNYNTIFENIGVFIIIVICLIILFAIFGIIQISCCYSRCCCTSLFLIFDFIVICLCLLIAFFGLINGFTSKINDLLGCDTKIKTISTLYDNIDHIYDLYDKTLCSEQCECNNATVVNVQSCPTDVIESIESMSNIKKFDFDIFANMFEYFEKNYKCSGWCNSFTTPKYRYIFSDVYNGKVEYSGCLLNVMKWFPKQIYPFSVLALICGIIAFISWLITLIAVVKF